MSLLLTLNRFYTLVWCFHCYFEGVNFSYGKENKYLFQTILTNNFAIETIDVAMQTTLFLEQAFGFFLLNLLITAILKLLA